MKKENHRRAKRQAFLVSKKPFKSYSKKGDFLRAIQTKENFS